MGRDLIEVIDAIAAVAPDIGDALRTVRDSARYTAPELSAVRWREAMEIIAELAPAHPEGERVRAIWMGDAL